MLKVTVAALAIVLAGTAGAAGWRSLRVDASSEAAFAESLTAFESKLSPSRRYALKLALREIWLQGTEQANAEQRAYSTNDYLRQLDGLSYDEVVRIPDPTGRAEGRYRAQYYAGYRLENGAPTQVWSAADPVSPTDAFARPLGHFPTDSPPPRENGESRFRPMGGEPGVNPWQR